MKTTLKTLVVGFIGALCLGLNSARADLEIAASFRVRAVTDFYAPLAVQGSWVDIRSYGHCWRPARIEANWRPYCYGQWVWTDLGWYWESDEPWAWACYHYGRWVYESDVGWVWVPEIEWAPAWGTWRFGGGYCGWAPLGPRDFVVAPSLFVFVDAQRFHERVTPSTVIVNNTTIASRTSEAPGPRRESRAIGGSSQQNVVINQGPSLETMQKATGKKVRQASINDVVQKTTVPREFKQTVREPSGAQTQPNTKEQPRVKEQPPAQERKEAPVVRERERPAPERSSP